ncbi:MAG: PadR family transcriptional regulator [Candidatus Verstraetearchaeota archaeon]|nr:PadR family transcriptional regulator [Candidatus Verstraetearchaeota archaeon]
MVDALRAFLRGLGGPLVLWVVSKNPMHGYGIIKEIERLTGERLKPATAYLLLNRLEENGFLASRLKRRGRRELKYYHLTDSGRTILAEISAFFNLPIKRMIANLLGEDDL